MNAQPINSDRFETIRHLGEGGFGAVYLAQQQEPVRRQVALKVIKKGMHSEAAMNRFRAERQLLALLHHPNIATIYEAGEFENGQPFFAMEWVEGIPITEFCDQHALRTAERLKLFRALCSAVQHAHHKGVIHRDLKPSNILVALHDGKPLLKIIDFGIAKTNQLGFDGEHPVTATGEFFGTPQYMSPEQSTSAIDVDTRSDIYSLGVILYELLTGQTPLGDGVMASQNRLEILEHIRLHDTPKPSTQLKSLGAELTTVAARRSTRPDRLARRIRGDLDWIVMKTLEKDRNRR